MKFLPFEKDIEKIYVRYRRTRSPEKRKILKEQLNRERESLIEKLSYREKVELARHPLRPRSSDLIPFIFSDIVEIHGDRCTGEDISIIAGFGRINEKKIAFVAQEKSRKRGKNILSAAGIRKAIRIMELADKFALPLVTLVDNPGTFPGFKREEEGLAYWISRVLEVLYSVRSPTISVVIGEGGSGGAVAFSITDLILMLENSIYMVIAPEASSVIIYRSPEKTGEVAKSMKILATELKELGLIDCLIKEPSGGAHWSVEETAKNIKISIEKEIAKLLTQDETERLNKRKKKFLNVGIKDAN